MILYPNFFPVTLFLQMLAFFQTVFTFYHQGFELANDFDHYKRALQINIQNVRHSVANFLFLLSPSRGEKVVPKYYGGGGTSISNLRYHSSSHN